MVQLVDRSQHFDFSAEFAWSDFDFPHLFIEFFKTLFDIFPAFWGFSSAQCFNFGHLCFIIKNVVLWTNCFGPTKPLPI